MDEMVPIGRSLYLGLGHGHDVKNLGRHTDRFANQWLAVSGSHLNQTRSCRSEWQFKSFQKDPRELPTMLAHVG